MSPKREDDTPSPKEGSADDDPAQGEGRQTEQFTYVPRRDGESPPPAASLDLEGGRYQIADEFARGGIARVLRATDRLLRRTVAIKEVKGDHPEAEMRFLQEALVTARLQHPSIVPVYDAGRWPEGNAYYAMKLVSGDDLHKQIAKQKDYADRLRLLPTVIAVADAIAYAHSESVLHRDLKPANVVVGEFGETVVIDWGIAKDLRSQEPDQKAGPSQDLPSEQTAQGTVVGTPSYMSPEQAAGEPVDERADIYSLGAMLYHLVSGRAPYAGQSGQAVLKAVQEQPPKPLEEVEPSVSPELLAIVEKAMARDPAKRYPTAQSLSEDLKRLQAGQYVSAHHYGLRSRMARFAAKHRIALIVAGVFAAALVALGAVSVKRIVEERNSALAQKQIAVEANVSLTLLQAENALTYDPTASIAWLKTLSPGRRSDDVSRIAAEAWSRGIASGVFAAPDDKGESPNSPAKRESVQIMLPGNKLITAGQDGRLKSWDLSESPPQTTILYEDLAPPAGIAASANGMWLAVVSRNGTVYVWQSPFQSQPRFLEVGSRNTKIAISPNGDYLVVGDGGQGLELRELPSLEKLAQLAARHPATPRGVAFDPNGATVAVVDNEVDIRIWHLIPVATGTGAELSRVLRGHSAGVTTLEFRGGKLLSTDASGELRVWPAATPERWRRYGHFQATPSPDCSGWHWQSRDGQRHFSKAADGSALPQKEDAPAPNTLPGQDRLETTSADGRTRAKVDTQGVVHFWDVAGNERVLSGHTGAVSKIAFSPSGALLASAGSDATVRVWTTEIGRSRVLPHQSGVRDLCFVDTGQLITFERAGTVRAWNKEAISSPNSDPALRAWLEALTTAKIDPETSRPLSLETVPSTRDPGPNLAPESHRPP